MHYRFWGLLDSCLAAVEAGAETHNHHHKDVRFCGVPANLFLSDQCRLLL